MTSRDLFEQYKAERYALGFSFKTNEGCIRRFLERYIEPEDGVLAFEKEYVLRFFENRQNRQASTLRREASAINGFLDFAIRKGFPAYKMPLKLLPKEVHNFKAYIFTDEEIERILNVADHLPVIKQNGAAQHQIPVMFRILFNCGLRSSELLNLRVCDVNFEQGFFTILNTKFHKNRLVPYSAATADALSRYMQYYHPLFPEAHLFQSSRFSGKYGNTWLRTHFRMLLRLAHIPYGGRERGPRIHDIRHTFAVHCLNRWVLSGEDIFAALPVLSRYLGHVSIQGTQKYLQLTAQMYPDITAKVEAQFGNLIPTMEVSDASN